MRKRGRSDADRGDDLACVMHRLGEPVCIRVVEEDRSTRSADEDHGLVLVGIGVGQGELGHDDGPDLPVAGSSLDARRLDADAAVFEHDLGLDVLLVPEDIGRYDHECGSEHVFLLAAA